MNKLLKLLATLGSVAVITGAGTKVADAAILVPSRDMGDAPSPLFTNIATNSENAVAIFNAYKQFLGAGTSSKQTSAAWSKALAQFSGKASMADFAEAMSMADLSGRRLLSSLQIVATRFDVPVTDVASQMLTSAFSTGGQETAEEMRRRLGEVLGDRIQLVREEGADTTPAYTG